MWCAGVTDVGVGGNTTAVVANARAMRAATTQVGELDLGGLLTVHRTLMARTSPDVAWRLRTEAVRTGGSDLAPIDALFVPPAHFETIHPFADGDHPR